MKTYKYTVLLETREDGYRAYCPAFPGCQAHGTSKEEAIRNIKMSIHHRLDGFISNGEPVPVDGDREMCSL